MRLITLLVLTLLSGSASATIIQSVSFYASNAWAGTTWCEDACFDALSADFDAQGTNPTDFELSGWVQTRGQYSRSSFNPSWGIWQGVSLSLEENDGLTYHGLCSDPYSDLLSVSFGVNLPNGHVFDGSGLMCRPQDSDYFEPAKGEFGYWREDFNGDGWDILGYVDDAGERVPEPGTLALLACSLAGLILIPRRN